MSSLRDYLIHLSMVVMGILIALSLESALENRHSHELAERATHDMVAEIQSNRAEIEQSLSGLDRARTQLLRQVQEQKEAIGIQQHHRKPPPEHPMESNDVAFPLLSSAAWDSALAMQAIGRINVDAAENLSRIYSSQAEVRHLQATFIDIALHFETYAGRPANDSTERMIDRLGALQQMLAALQNLLSGYRDLLHQYVIRQIVFGTRGDLILLASVGNPAC